MLFYSPLSLPLVLIKKENPGFLKVGFCYVVFFKRNGCDWARLFRFLLLLVVVCLVDGGCFEGPVFFLVKEGVAVWMYVFLP